jgi:hypothetical protein
MLRLFILLCVVAGCAADEYGSFVILNNQAPPSGDVCAFTADENNAFITRGQLSTSVPSSYLLTPLFASRIKADMGKELQRTVALHGARIDLTVGPILTIEGGVTSTIEIDPTDPELGQSVAGVTKFQTLFSAALPPNGFSAASFDLVPAQVVDLVVARAQPSITRAIHAQVVANVVAFGDLQGTEIVGDPFQYPVTICSDCVVSNLGLCSDIPLGDTGRAGNPCNPFQDGALDCCIGSAGQAVCPSVGTMPQ